MFRIPQPNPATISATGTITIAQMMARIVIVTSATAVNLTLDTGALCDAGIASGNLANDGAFDWCIQNAGSAVGLITMIASAGHTLLGLTTIPIITSGSFRTRKTGANTFVTYRLP